MDQQLEGKTAIVTGGSSGFGAAISQRFINEGAHVVVADITPADIGTYARCDVTKESDLKALASRVMDEFGAVDILVNNAGMTHLPTPLDAVDAATFDALCAVNMRSIYLAAQIFVPLMKAAKSGVILNMASTAGVRPRPHLVWYNASKGWVINVTRSMAVELAPFGIRVNALNPTLADTPMLPRFLGEDTPEVREKFLATIPLGRFVSAEDVANAAAFFCRDSASMVTGVCMEVDGGRCI
jgi:3-oxoacyl-[acyl-carrier protein] reductase